MTAWKKVAVVNVGGSGRSRCRTQPEHAGFSTTQQSGDDGEFNFLYLDPGTYEVSILKPVPGEKFNSFRGPTFKDFDFSVSRVFRLGEHYQLGVRAEAFNLFNHPNYQQNVIDNVQYTANLVGPNPAISTDQLWTAAPNSDFGAPGAIVPKFGSRSFQFSTRFIF